jgi:hypothetical protein
MTSHFSAASPALEADVLTPAPTDASNRPDSLWQRMFQAWIHTYELSSSSGAVPFLLL